MHEMDVRHWYNITYLSEAVIVRKPARICSPLRAPVAPPSKAVPHGAPCSASSKKCLLFFRPIFRQEV